MQSKGMFLLRMLTLLNEKPKLAGIDVPENSELYQVIAFTQEGKSSIYSEYKMK